NGRRVAFVRTAQGTRAAGLYVVTSDGLGLRRVLSLENPDPENGTAGYLLRWSPRSASLASDPRTGGECEVSAAFNLRLMVSSAKGRGSEALPVLARPRKLVGLLDIRWSRDGKRFLYIVGEYESGEDPSQCGPFSDSLLYTVGSDGRGRHLIV